MPIPIQSLKFNIIDVVASGDLPLQALLQANVDMLWSLNQRRSTVQAVQYLYTMADALRMGMEFTRGNIDQAQTDSDHLDVKRGKNFSTRAFDARNSSSGFTTISIAGSSAEDESTSRVSDISNTSREHSDHSLSSSTSGSDRSRTGSSLSRDTGESMVTADTATQFVTTVQSGSTDYEATSTTDVPIGAIFSQVHSIDTNATVFGTNVRFGFRDGSGHTDVTTARRQFGRVSDADGNIQSNVSFNSTDTLIDDFGTTTGRGTLAGGLAELGSGTDFSIRNAHTSGASVTDDHATSSTTHNASGSRHQLATMTALQTSASDGHSVTSSSSTDLSHGESQDFGESNEQMTATIDYLGQLFDNLKMMYANVMEQIKAFEPQIAVGQRYTNNRMTTRNSPLPKIGNLIEFNPLFLGR